MLVSDSQHQSLALGVSTCGEIVSEVGPSLLKEHLNYQSSLMTGVFRSLANVFPLAFATTALLNISSDSHDNTSIS